jgi:hypothetical protein
MSILETWLAEAESWVGTPYVTEGCTKGFKGGSDCGHWFIKMILAVIPNSENVAFVMDISHVQYFKKNVSVVDKVMSPLAFQVTLKEIQPGDVVFLEYRRISSQPCIYVGDDHFIYCDTSMREMVKRPLPGNYIERIVHVFRFKCIAEEQ